MADIFLVPTGNIIKEYLSEYGYTQKEACARLGVSEKHFSNLVNGNVRLTEDVALKLENLLPLPASYWLNFESKYREYLARTELNKNLESEDLQALAKKFRFSEVFAGMEWNLLKQAQEMLKLLKISSFENFEAAYSNLPIRFMEDGGQKEAIAIWLNMCESEIDIQNDIPEGVKFSVAKLKKSLDEIKSLTLNNNVAKAFLNCRKICNSLGINLVIVEALPGCKVRGALTTKQGRPTIYLSGRFKTHDHIWFAFIHEIAHLILHYNVHDTLISEEENSENSIEQEANDFARTFFVNEASFASFKCARDFSVASITRFAREQRVLNGIIVAFLQHDTVLANNRLNHLKIPFDINDLTVPI